ncbi:MAG: hypothetical protein RL266_104 [Bacteroidota bacterium]|jgi:peroxiredoxin
MRIRLVRPFGLLAVALILTVRTMAQTTGGAVSVTITDQSVPAPRVICLNCFSNGHFQFTDSATVSQSTRTIELQFGNFIGSCELNLLGRKDPGSEFIANPEELIEIETDFRGITNGSIAISGSTENLLYGELQKTREQSNSALNKLLKLRDQLSPYQPNYLAEIQRLDRSIEQLKDSINASCDAIVKGHDNLFVSRVTRNLVKLPTRSASKNGTQYDTHTAFLHEHYFDFIDFNDPQTFHHYALTFLLEQYFAKYSSTVDRVLYNSCDMLMRKAESNPSARDYMYNFLVDYGVSRNMEYLTSYMQENYGSDCELNLKSSQSASLKAMNNVQIGKVAPDMLLYDNEGNPRSLNQFVQKHDHTVLLFWISWCARCHKELPKFALMKRLMEERNIGLFTVGLDENPDIWKSEIRKYNLPGVHVSEQVALEQSKVLREYGIRTTPALFILDSKGEIVYKNIFGDELEAVLRKLSK